MPPHSNVASVNGIGAVDADRLAARGTIVDTGSVIGARRESDGPATFDGLRAAGGA